jgi:hypothetical protein
VGTVFQLSMVAVFFKPLSELARRDVQVSDDLACQLLGKDHVLLKDHSISQYGSLGLRSIIMSHILTS